MKLSIEASWKKILSPFLRGDFFKKLQETIEHEYRTQTIFPQLKNVFNAFNSTPFDRVTVIIIGQDPYHNPGQAHGLSFSVPKGTPLPPSLRNIYREIESDLGVSKDYGNGDLSTWAEQGVLLLNSVLTVRENEPGSHANRGWEKFSDYVIEQISNRKEHCVFILWGKYAEQKRTLIDESRHLVLSSPHPSPFSAHKGFFGNRHFTLANDYLNKHGKKPIEW